MTLPHSSLDAVGDLQEKLAPAGEGSSVCLLQPAAQGQLPLESFGQSGFNVAIFWFNFAFTVLLFLKKWFTFLKKESKVN